MVKDSDISEVIERLRKKGILTKRDCYTLYNAGVFGNRALAWDTLEALRKSSWRGEVCIRDARGTNRGKNEELLPKYNIPYAKLESTLDALVKRGIPLEAMRFNQSMPDGHLRIQGELTRGMEGNLHLTYSTIQKPMRQALLENEQLEDGIKAQLLLEHHLWPPSINEVMHCLDYFSSGTVLISPVIEFSTYDIAVGDISGRNTVIWEVRNY